MSDSSYPSLTRHRRPLSTAGRPPALDVIDDLWASETLSDDEIDVEQHEAVIAPMLEEGDLDVDAVVVLSTSLNSAVERRRREEGRWNDLALDYFFDYPDGSNYTGGGMGHSSSSVQVPVHSSGAADQGGTRNNPPRQ